MSAAGEEVSDAPEEARYPREPVGIGERQRVVVLGRLDVRQDKQYHEHRYCYGLGVANTSTVGSTLGRVALSKRSWNHYSKPFLMETNLNSFRSDRRFSVFSYGIGHGPLLLRSGKTNEHHTRIDVLVLDVRAMEIRSWFESIEITKVDQEYLRNFRSNPIEMIEVGLSAYALHGKGWQGFVVGGNLCVHEDEADFTAPSEVLRW